MTGKESMYDMEIFSANLLWKITENLISSVSTPTLYAILQYTGLCHNDTRLYLAHELKRELKTKLKVSSHT